MPEFTINWVPPSSVKPYEHNPRINDRAIGKVAASIKEFGWRQPIVVDEHNVIIIGHCRLKAALQLGCTEVPVHKAEGLTPAQVKALRLADNRTRDDSLWDTDLLEKELGELQMLEFPLDLTGFDENELTALLAASETERDAEADAGSAEEAPSEALAQPGDVWQFGIHRIWCGDPANEKRVKHLMGGTLAKVCVLDWPAGWGLSEKWGAPKAEDVEMLRLYLKAASLTPDCALYLWLPSPMWAPVLPELGITIKGDLVWVMSRSLETPHYRQRHAQCFYGYSEREPLFQGDDEQNTVWEFADDDGTKPVAMLTIPLLNHTRKGDIAYAPFAGNGSLLLAAERIGRIFRGCEPDPGKLDTVIARWKKLTGRAPQCECPDKNS